MQPYLIGYTSTTRAYTPQLITVGNGEPPFVARVGLRAEHGCDLAFASLDAQDTETLIRALHQAQRERGLTPTAP